MDAGLLDALRDRLRPRLFLGTVVVLVGFHQFLGASIEQLVTMGAMAAVSGATDVVADVYDLRQSVKNASVGGIAVIGGLTMLAFGEEPSPYPFVFLAIGAWFLLDAVQTIRHEGATTPTRDGWDVYRTYVSRRVYETLDERPRTRRELSDVLEADDEPVDAAIEDLRSRGVVVREGSELRLSSSDPEGTVARAREGAIGVAERIARPFLLELGTEASADEDGDRAGPGPGTEQGEDIRSEDRRGVPDDDREHEAAKES